MANTGPRQPATTRGELIKAIHAMGRELRLDADMRRTMQQQLTGHESCADMPVAGLKQVYRRLWDLRRDQPKPKTPRKRSGRDERQPDEPITVEQQLMISHLCDDLEAQAVTPLAPTWRQALATRTCGTPWPQTRVQGNQLMEALKAMLRRGTKLGGRNQSTEGACTE
jgi:hypothetical protein